MAPRQSYQDRAKRIAEFYLRVDKDREKVLLHFEDEGVPARTIHRIIRLFEKRGDVAFKKIPGRGKKIIPEEAHEKIALMYKANPKLPSGEAARALGVSRTTLLRMLAEMKAQNKETYKAPAENVTCPTCRQKCDPEVLESFKANYYLKKRTSKGTKSEDKIEFN